MRLPIPEEIRRALSEGTGGPVELFDPQTQTRYVLVPADEYARVRDNGAAAIRETYAAQDAVARAAGWDDPIMDEYNNYDAPRRSRRNS